jgi:hypothetical protein
MTIFAGHVQGSVAYPVISSGEDPALRQRVTGMTRQPSCVALEDPGSPLKLKAGRLSMISYLMPFQFPFASYSSVPERD